MDLHAYLLATKFNQSSQFVSAQGPLAMLAAMKGGAVSALPELQQVVTFRPEDKKNADEKAESTPVAEAQDQPSSRWARYLAIRYPQIDAGQGPSSA